MRRLRRSGFAALAPFLASIITLSQSLPALAQTSPAAPAPGPTPGNVVVPSNAPTDLGVSDDWGGATITVMGRAAGPALWRVRKGDSEVFIVGGLPVMVKRFDWDRKRIGHIIDEANVYLVSPKAKGGAFSFVEWQMTKGPGMFKTLYDVLPGDVGGRFWRVAKQNGFDPTAYAHDAPVYAAMKLRDDIYEKRGLSTNDPEKMLIFMARDRKTPMKPMASYSASNLLGKVNKMSTSERNACVSATLNEIEFATRHAETATDAWKTGDLAGARDNSPPSAMFACLDGGGATQGLLAEAIDDAVSAVDDALKKPGKSVVVFPLSVLLRPNGAFDRLRAQGAEITEPTL